MDAKTFHFISFSWLVLHQPFPGVRAGVKNLHFSVHISCSAFLTGWLLWALGVLIFLLAPVDVLVPSTLSLS